MVALPEDIKEGIKQLSDKVDVPVKSLLSRLKEIVETDEQAQAMEDQNFKIRFAWGMLLRENSMTGKTTDCYVMPISKPSIRDIEIKGEKTKVGNMTALIQILEKDEGGNIVEKDVQYAHGSFWRDGAVNVRKLESGKVYKTSLITKENSWGVGITSDRAGFTLIDKKVVPFDDFFKNEIEPRDIFVTIDSMDLNKSEEKNDTDIRIIEATVVEADVGTTNDGREYGRYNIMDTTIIGSTIAVFVDPEEVCWAQGSILRFGGTISLNKNGEPRWNHQFIVPVNSSLAMPMKIEISSRAPSANKQDEVDITKEEEKEEKPSTSPPKVPKEPPVDEPAKTEKGKKAESDDDLSFEI